MSIFFNIVYQINSHNNIALLKLSIQFISFYQLINFEEQFLDSHNQTQINFIVSSGIYRPKFAYLSAKSKL
ncbi:hypothetical protein BpHYR1_031840 [Brachionus plicatilis]|uniref:Uncharacterized protein n=1 Tax=Brachionus plicatilis TaxID=10195 RepID=A0A3M7QLZ9_BRAPC|nr:hypothetical protein BpHYR1_031840 [Brachionus plicatilis]